MRRDWSKWWQYFFLAAWPSFARSAIFTAIKVDWRICVLSVGEAVYQGVIATKALDSNPNKTNK